MLRKWGTLVLLLLAMPALALAQNTGKLSGRVTDASTGEPLPGANVLLEGTQLGTITDVDGNYFIIGVPVGQYSVQSSFVGFQTQVVSGVEINSGYTRELNFSLQPGVELNEIVVEYERPLIQKDAIGTPRVVSGEQIENLPVRGVASVAAIQGGVVANEGSNNLFIRGGREQEVSYYVDGVKVLGSLAVPQQSIQEQEMLIGTIPARYGDAMSGIISITTKTGGSDRFFGTIEGISSQVLDPFGYNLGSLSLGGPIIPRKASFFISAEGSSISDSDPFSTKVPYLSDDMFNMLQSTPQVISVRDQGGNLSYVPFPSDIQAGATAEDVEALLEQRGVIGGATGMTLASNNPRSAFDFMDGSSFNRESSKDDPSLDLDVNGNITITPLQQVSLRLGGAYAISNDQTFNFSRFLYARNQFYHDDRTTWRAFGNWRHYVSNATFYEIGVNFTDYKGWFYPEGFSKNVEDVLFYGDVDGIIQNADGAEVSRTPGFGPNAAARNYWSFDSETEKYMPVYTDGNTPSGGGVYGMFALPGTRIGEYDQFHRQQFRLNATATTQIGLNQIEFGAEYEQRTLRRFNIHTSYSRGLARYYNDGKPETSLPNGGTVDSWNDLPIEVLESTIRSGNWYGYNYLGTTETSDQDLASYARYMLGRSEETNANTFNVAPHQPIYYAGYIQDKIEFRDLIVNLGLRVDVFDNNTQVLKDPYAGVPLVRAGAVSNLPAGIGSDYAVYFPDANPSNAPVGYRDLDGNFYDAQGQRSTFKQIGRIGKPAEDRNADFTSIFEDYEPQVTFMPRIGVSFPVTDQALFFASYNVLAQRPSEQAFVPAQTYVGLGNEYIANPNLKPETTTQYELGFRQRVGARAALQLSGFYRTQNNKIQIRSLPSAVPVHNSYYNVDFATTKGATFEFDLRRTNNIAINANYTLQFAQASGSDSETMQQIAWRGDYFPNFISAADFDRRHTLNLTMDYRFGPGEGPEVFGARLLENFGVNVLATIKSGMPYTEIRQPIIIPVYEDRHGDAAGGLNSAYMPWTNLVDLRIDRRFQLGGGTSLTAFLWVQNLLDVNNVLGVYRGTGLADDDGFLDSGAGSDAITNAIDSEAFVYHYRTFLDNPLPLEADFTGERTYGLPRRTRLGVRLSF